ncbi:MAG: hypothetical protein MSB80_03235 [Alphaproteobacteria bacterium]|nr:hypothetical protein [Alphaproteobacteria bacterium]
MDNYKNNVNAEEKCFIVAFGAEHDAGIYCSEIAQKIYNILSPIAYNVWLCPKNTKVIPTKIPNVFFVKGYTSEIKLSKFYRDKIEPLLIANSNTKKEHVDFYVKEVEDEEVSLYF